MKMKRKALFAAALALCLAAVSLSACSSNFQGTSGSGSADVKVIKIGVDTVSMPNAYVGEDGSRLGFLRGPLSLARQHLIEKRIKAIR